MHCKNVSILHLSGMHCCIVFTVVQTSMGLQDSAVQFSVVQHSAIQCSAVPVSKDVIDKVRSSDISIDPGINAPLQCIVQSTVQQCSALYKVQCNSAVYCTKYSATVQCIVQSTVQQCGVLYKVQCNSAVYFTMYSNTVQCTAMYYKVLYFTVLPKTYLPAVC